MSLENTMLSEIRQRQKAIYYMIPFQWNDEISRIDQSIEAESKLVGGMGQERGEWEGMPKLLEWRKYSKIRWWQ